MSWLDTRDLYKEYNDLQSSAGDDLEPMDQEDTERLRILTDLFNEIGEAAGIHGGTLIPDSEFADYAKDLAEDISAVESSAWPFRHIDWEAAGNELKSDYQMVTFDGEDLWYRA